ncbi:MAG: polysulfide reductase NrfD [Acidimicrobiaceae bacterium]|nr:polysulfide reductase NrfD [Acidimicrobiaceae bacterium]
MTAVSPTAGGGAGPQNVFMDQFDLQARTQRVWDINHAIWFTLMGAGGGVFLVGRILNLTEGLGYLLGIPTVDVVSFLAIAVGGAILVADLGRPLQAWRAFVNVRTSWISWGAWSDLIFLVVAGLLVLPALSLGGSEPFSGLGWDPHGGDGGGLALEIIAGVAAVVVMTYAGAVLARPRAIPYWNSPAVPLQFLLSSAAMSVAVVMLIEVIAGEPVSSGQMVLLGLLTAGLTVTVVVHLLARTDAPGKKESLDRLLRGQYRSMFVWGVFAGGTVAPAVLAFTGAVVGASGARDALAVICCVLLVPGGFWLRLLTLRVGIFPPVHIPSVSGSRMAAP